MNTKKMTKASKDNITTVGMIVVVYAVVMILRACGMVNNQMEGLLVPLCVYAIMAVSLNLVAGILGFLIGIPVLRLNGDYLAIVTLAFGEIIKNIINVLFVGKDSAGLHFSMKSQMALGMGTDGKVIIAGPMGITGTPFNANFTVGFIILLVSTILVLNLINSREGRAIMSIRDNRIAAASVGIPVTKYRMLAFTISAVIAGFAGALYAHNLASLIATPARFGYNMSILFLVFVVLGGIGSTRGAIIASVVLTLIPEVLRFMANYRMLIYSIVLIVMMIVNWNPTSRAWIAEHSLKKMLSGKKNPGSEQGKEGR